MTEEQNYGCEHNKKKCFMKYLGVLGATLLGAFLAFYFVADMTIKHMMDPMYQVRKMDKMFEHQARQMDKMDKRMMREMGMPTFHRGQIVAVENLDDEYKIIIDLRPFDDNEKNIIFELNDNMATIKASVEKEKRHEENIVNFQQTFYLDGDLDIAKIKKEKVKNKYVITIPEKD